jgi:PadR family transcriptional regulator AphA
VRTSTERTTTTLTATEAALLGLLARGGPRSGYDLKKAVDASVGYFWKPAKTQIYAVLPRLVAAGLATRRAVVQSDRPDKQVYRVTAAGRNALTEWLEAPPEADGDRTPFLLRVYLGGLASPEALARHIQARREEAEALKADLEAIDARVGDGGDYHASLTRRFGLETANAVIRWASDVERELDP